LVLFLNIIFVLVGLGMIASVLLQSAKSAGFTGTFTGGAQSIFGKKKGLDDLLAKFTVIFAVLFVILAMILTPLLK